MLAHNEYHSLDECILVISRYEDKSAGYGLRQENTAHAAPARSCDVRSNNAVVPNPNVDEQFPNLSLMCEDTQRLSDMW